MAEPSVQGRIHSVFREDLPACLAAKTDQIRRDWKGKKKGPVRDGTGP
jgi:hypothetical protein